MLVHVHVTVASVTAVTVIPRGVADAFVAQLDEHATTGTLEETWAAELQDYAVRDHTFADRMRSGLEPGPFVVLERELIVATQSTSGTSGKVDLRAQLDAFEVVTECSTVGQVLLGADIELERVEADGWTIIDHDDERTVARRVCEGNRLWPAELGGPANAWEIERIFEVTVRRAPWRDRAVRRLQQVVVAAVEAHTRR